MLTRRGGRWHKSTVMNLLDRLGPRDKENARPQIDLGAVAQEG
jgi:hypothetical protein